MDSIEFTAEVADRTREALNDAGVTVSSASRLTGIPRSTLERKFNAGKGIQSLTVRELHDLAKVAGTTISALTKVYEVPDEVVPQGQTPAAVAS